MKRIGEYAHVAKAFALLALALASSKTIVSLQDFHFFGFILPCLNYVMEFQLQTYLEFSLNIFKLTFIHSIQLLASGPLGMVFEHL